MRRHDIRMNNKALQDEFAALYEGEKTKSMTESSSAKVRSVKMPKEAQLPKSWLFLCSRKGT